MKTTCVGGSVGGELTYGFVWETEKRLKIQAKLILLKSFSFLVFYFSQDVLASLYLNAFYY